MRISKVVSSSDKKDTWITIRTEDESDFLVIHIQGSRFLGWTLKGMNLNVRMQS
jgi:hypothetical protein